MTVIKLPSYLRAVASLPREIQILATHQEARFQQNLFDPRLHMKKLKGLDDYSIRVTRNYRILLNFRDANTAIWYDIDHRKDVYR